MAYCFSWGANVDAVLCLFRTHSSRFQVGPHAFDHTAPLPRMLSSCLCTNPNTPPPLRGPISLLYPSLTSPDPLLPLLHLGPGAWSCLHELLLA